MDEQPQVIPRQIFHFWVTLTITFIVGGIGVAWSVICQRLLLFPISNAGSILNTLWQVQAGVTMLSISIMAIIIGFSNERLFGFRLPEYLKLNIVVRNVKLPINFWDEAVLGLYLIPLTYIFVAIEGVAGAFMLLLASIALIIHMLQTVLSILTSSQKTKENIRRHVLQTLTVHIQTEGKN